MNAEFAPAPFEESAIDPAIDQLFVRFDAQRARTIDRALRRCSGSSAAYVRLDQMHRLCLLFAHFSKPVDGYAVARAAVKTARQLGDHEALRKALTTRGALRLMAGDINSAIEDNVEAYELARVNDEAMAVAPLSNLVFALGLIDLDDLALRLAEYALERLPLSLVSFPHLNAATSLMVNVSDLLLGKDPRRALRLACDVEKHLGSGSMEKSASSELQRATRLASAFINQLIAAVNLGDKQLASRAVAKLQQLIGGSPIPRVLQTAGAALATFEARYGDHASGLQELKRASGCEVDEVAVDASRRLAEYYEAVGRPDEAAEALRSLQSRLQSIRRTVGLEELRRIAALDHVGEFDEYQGETEKWLSRFAVSAAGMSERLSAKLTHLESIAVAAELREGTEMNRAQHIYRVGKLCLELASEAGCSQEIQWLAETTGRLHDIGKCAVPDTTILSASPLPEAMRAIIREHSDYGARLIADADEPRLVQVVAAVRHHHERFDGKGYPSNLLGDEIPLLARVVAICESYDAMLQSRTYRSSRTYARALEEIERSAGTQFDPQLVGLFVRVVRRLQRQQGDVLEYLGADSRNSPPVRTFEQLERLMTETRTVL